MLGIITLTTEQCINCIQSAHDIVLNTIILEISWNTQSKAAALKNNV